MSRNCLSKVLAAAGAAFLALLSAAESIDKYLVGTVPVWLILGTLTAAAWAYEHFCYRNEGGKDE